MYNEHKCYFEVERKISFMKNHFNKKYFIWLFPLAVAVMIFCFSSQHAEESSNLSNFFVQIFLSARAKLGLFPKLSDADLLSIFSTLVRKGAHVTEYIILCTSFLTAFWVSGIHGKWRNIASFAMTFGYACKDEFHQLFVPGRAGRFTDVLIDSSGALVLSIVVVLVMRYRGMNRQQL